MLRRFNGFKAGHGLRMWRPSPTKTQVLKTESGLEGREKQVGPTWVCSGLGVRPRAVGIPVGQLQEGPGCEGSTGSREKRQAAVLKGLGKSTRLHSP